MRKFLTMCLLLVASFVACEKTPNVEVSKPELKLLSNPVILFDEQGGDGEIRYELKNPVAEVKLGVEVDAEWVSDVVVAESIKFVVAANDAESVRTAQVVVSYDKLNFTVELRQAAKKAVEPENPETPEQPEDPKDPETPEQPEDPETPEQPEDPETPEQPEDPETPEQPEDPETPEQPEDPETPEQPEDPETPEQPEDPETPEQPEDPETPEQPEDPETPAEPEQPKPQLWILSDSVLNFAAEGGAGEVLYRVDNPVEGVAVGAKCDQAWVGNIVVGETIAFVVEANDTALQRTAKFVVSYKVEGYNKSYVLDIVQAANKPAPEPEPEPEPTPDPEPLPDGYDVAYRAQCLSGEYSGQTGSVYNYYIILADVKCANWRDIMQPNSHFYCFDIYAKSKSDVLPNGVYEIDLKETHKAGTIDANVSPCVETDANGDFVRGMLGYESGTLTVSDNKIVAELVLSNGETHYVIYQGSLKYSYK